MVYTIEFISHAKNDENDMFYKKVKYTSRAKSLESKIVEKEVSGWIDDTIKTFNLSRDYSVELVKV